MAANADGAWTTADLCQHIYGVKMAEKKHRVAVIRALAAIMRHVSRFCPLGWRTHAVDPSVWIGVRQLAVQRIGD